MNAADVMFAIAMSQLSRFTHYASPDEFIANVPVSHPEIVNREEGDPSRAIWVIGRRVAYGVARVAKEPNRFDAGDVAERVTAAAHLANALDALGYPAGTGTAWTPPPFDAPGAIAAADLIDHVVAVWSSGMTAAFTPASAAAVAEIVAAREQAVVAMRAATSASELAQQMLRFVRIGVAVRRGQESLMRDDVTTKQRDEAIIEVAARNVEHGAPLGRHHDFR